MSDRRRDNQDEERRSAGDALPVELLSAYLDDPEDLTPEDRRTVEARLEQDPETRRALAEVRLIAGELRELPAIPAPRSYHLDEEMVGVPEPVAIHQTSAWHERRVEVVRWATAAAAILFVVVLSADLLLHNIWAERSGEERDAFPMSAAAPDEADDEAEEDALFEVAEDTAVGEGDEPGIMADEAEAVEEEEADEAPAQDDAPPAALRPDVEEAPSDDDADTDEAGEVVREVGPEDGDDAEQLARAAETTALEPSSADEPDRQRWRIAQFSLVVLLGLLITALVLLRRTPSGRAGASGGHRGG